MGEIITGLKRRGLVRRQESAVNGRILRVSLTAEGRKLLVACDAILDRVETECFERVAARQLASMRELLRDVLGRLRLEDGAAPGAASTKSSRKITHSAPVHRAARRRSASS
jgi:hypothetical protein